MGNALRVSAARSALKRIREGALDTELYGYLIEELEPIELVAALEKLLREEEKGFSPSDVLKIENIEAEQKLKENPYVEVAR